MLPILAMFCVAMFVTLLLRMGCFSVLTIPYSGQEPVLQLGDRVLVQKWAFGYRSTWRNKYRRFRPTAACRGDWAAYNCPNVQREALPDTSQMCVGCVFACPGDTVWMGSGGHVSNTKNFSNGCIWPIVVPARGTQVKMTSWNQALYALTIQRHEPLAAEIIDDSLCVDGNFVDYYKFQRNYYWMSSTNDRSLNDSRAYGFVPEEFLLGKVSTVLYSLDGEAPFYRKFRWDRMLKKVGDE